MLGAHTPRIFRRLGATQNPQRPSRRWMGLPRLCHRSACGLCSHCRAGRTALRTGPSVGRLFRLVRRHGRKAIGKANLAEAFRYALNRREALSKFVTDGRLEIDNNIAENAMHCIAVGRKNYLFAGSDSGGEKAASIYTIVRTAKLNGVNPEIYLRDVLAKVASGHPINRIDELRLWARPMPDTSTVFSRL